MALACTMPRMTSASERHRVRHGTWPLAGPVLGRWLSTLVCAAAVWANASAQGPAQGLAPMPVMEEVPFITTPDNVTVSMLELAGVNPKDFVLDLGSGDGRIVITAAFMSCRVSRHRGGECKAGKER